MSYDSQRGASKRWLLWIIVALVIAGAATGAWLHWHPSKADSPPKSASPVPAAVSQAVSFPVYYPDQAKLPTGYVLNSSSFKTPVKNGVTYSVSYGNNQKLVFSVQAKPSDSELESFKTNYIPLRIDYQTDIGQAEIGAYNNHGNTETLVSLPTNTNAWVIVTCPYDINQDNLKQVLSSLRK
jgi:hypothetical protein